MNSKIARKLTLYFSVALLLFSIIIGSVFLSLFKKHTIEVHKADLEKRAVTIASTLSDFMGSANSQGGRGGTEMGAGGYGPYMRFLGDITMTDVWIVDENLNLITSGNMSGHQYNYADLPQNAETVVQEVFQGNTTFSEGFSALLNTPTLTIGTPISSGGVVVGALLLHSSVVGMNAATTQGIVILTISIVIALVLSFLFSSMLAAAFTRPLKMMQVSALLLAGGDYTVKTEVEQKDEIGELAAAIDILSERLELSKHESENLNKLRRDFVANISYELKTPVTAIRGSLEALYEGVVTEASQVQEFHKQMLSESLYLQRLVHDLLDLSKLQNTDFKMQVQKLNLRDVLNDVVRSAGQLAQLKNIAIHYIADTELLDLKGDYGRLRQMFLIVLDNAIKFSQSGDVVEVTIKDKTISVLDHLICIAPLGLPHISDRFYKVQSENNKSGSGLGLAIAKQIADRHGLEIIVNSSKTSGTEFRFLI